MSLDLDAKSIAIGGAAVFAATQLFGGSKKKGTAGLGKPGKRKASGTKKASTAKTKKSTASKGKSKK